MYNPTWQNHAHMRALGELLGLPAETIHGYVVFCGGCELKEVPTEAKGSKVVCLGELAEALEEDLPARAETTLDSEMFAHIHYQLDSMAADSTAEARTSHVSETKQVKDGLICPQCGGTLVRRTGKYGPFLGCSNYPSCHYTRKLTA